MRIWLRRQRPASTPSLETVRATLRAVRAERDHALLLLRVVRHYGLVEWGPLYRDINRTVALESESDIEDAQREVDRYVTDALERA